MSAGWNYRIIHHPAQKHLLGKTEVEEDAYYAIHEVYYDDKGNPDMYAINFIICGDSIQELKEILQMMEQSIDKDIINSSEFE